MSALLGLIWCWLRDIFAYFNDYAVSAYDGLLGVADSALSGLAGSAITIPTIDPQYTWALGATGCSQALAIIGGALMTRFLLQSIPFVRWGSK
jgi:hypothetical protein